MILKYGCASQKLGIDKIVEGPKMKSLKPILISFVIFILLSGSTHAQVTDVWMRTDADAAGVYIWYGGASKMGGLNLAHEFIYYIASNEVEFEIGPVFNLLDNRLSVIPMLGNLTNMSTGITSYLLPQLYFYFNSGKTYAEIWHIYYHGIAADTYGANIYYGRYIFKFALTDNLSIGPEIEPFVEFADDANGDMIGISSMLAGVVAGFPYGENNTLDVFLGIDTKADNAVRARLTFIRHF